MAKVVDITDKLTFDGNPFLRIKDTEIEVNASAPSVIKIMNLRKAEKFDEKAINEMCNLIFPGESMKKVNALNLCFSDLLIVIEAAVNLAVGGEKSQGE